MLGLKPVGNDTCSHADLVRSPPLCVLAAGAMVVEVTKILYRGGNR